jgi:A/G-specific adenine glycosylase
VLLTDFYRLDTEVQPPLPADYLWVPETSLDDYAKPRLIELLFSDQSGMELK